MTPLISIVTPSIRPRGLESIHQTLKEQTYTNWEWLPRLSVPREHPDLCYQVNQALDEAKGEIIVFVQDFILLRPTSLERIVDLYREHGSMVAFTFPTGKVTHFDSVHPDEIKWDWRKYATRNVLPYSQWEIDFGYVSREALDLAGGGFDEGFDTAGGFSGENVELAWRLEDAGVTFKCDPTNSVLVLDHEELNGHEWRNGETAGRNEEYMREQIKDMELARIQRLS